MELEDNVFDCGTDKFITVTIPSINYKSFINRYIIEDGQLVKITKDTCKKYAGVKVNLRTPSCCSNSITCQVCGGYKYLFR